MKVDILAFGAHPDDVELSASGTLLKHIDMGKTVGLVDLTEGELGTRGNAAIRKQEADNAACLMGAKFREQLYMKDGFFQHSEENMLKIICSIRNHQPEIVLATALDDRHPDHARAAKLIADACFFAGLAKIETKSANGQPQEIWRPKAVYHYVQDRHLEPDFVVDIGPWIEKKFDLILAFRSQFFNPDAPEYQEEKETPISGKSFLEFLRAKGANFGRPAGFNYAEGFNVARTPGVNSLFDLI